MKVLHSWIQDYIEETLPSANDIAEELTMHAFEIEGVETLPDGDAIIDVDVLPNRAHDSLCHYGLAREIATLFNLTFRIPDISYETDTALKSSDVLSLSIEKSALVPRATKRLLSDIVVGPSPELIKTRLEKLGQRSINNVVDITNYVMLETGQPVHAFDFAKVSKGKEKKEFTIRGAREGEKVATLDGKEFTLSEGMLVIADEDRALDIAGIKGGVDSGIDEHTKQLILSACNFNSTAIRKTSRKLGLLTDASKRFEQGITPEIITRAVERASELFQKYASARVASDIVDVYPRRRNPYMLGVSVSEVNAVLGLSLSEDDVASVLKRLAFSNVKVAPRDTIIALAKNLEGAEYMYGASVVCDAPQRFDCSSLINYLYSRVGLPVPRMTVDQYVFGDAIEKEDLKPGDIVFSRNRNGDIAQTKTFTRVADGQEVTQETLHAVSKEFMPGVEVQGGVDHNGMYLGDGKILHAARKNGVVALEPLEGNDAFMDIVGYRRFLQTEEDRFVVTVPDERLDLRIIEDLIEEIGRVYGYDKIPSGKLSSDVAPIFNKKFYYVNKVRDLLVENGYSEVYMYSFASKGDIEVQNPPAENRKFLRKTLSDGLENSVEQGMYYKDFLGLSAVRIFEIGTVFEGDSEHLALAVRLSGVKDKVRDTELAMVAEKLSALLGVEIGVQNGAIEVNLTDSIQKLPDPTSHDDLASIDTQGKMFAPLSQYPFVLRDIAVWTPENVVSSEIQKLIEEVAGPLLVRMALFDEFKKEGKVSYAFHLVFQSMEKTLADTDVEVPMKRVTDAFAEKGWTVR